jgi:AcrR family transcriptional regulator
MLAKARILFWKKGYYGTSMRDIATACNCKSANIYNYFPSKEDILFEMLKNEMELIVDPVLSFEKDDTADPVEQLRLMIETHVSITLGRMRSSKMLFDTDLGSLSPAKRKIIIEMRDTYDRILCAIIQRGVDRGVFAQIDVKMAAYSIASMIVRTRMWFSPRGRLSVKEVQAFIFAFALNALKGKTAGH